MTLEGHSQKQQGSGYTTGRDTEQRQDGVRRGVKKRGDSPKSKWDTEVVSQVAIQGYASIILIRL